MPAQRPFKVGDVVVTVAPAFTGREGKDRVPAGTAAVVESVKLFGSTADGQSAVFSTADGQSAVFATIPATGETGACFWFSEIRLVEDPDA